MKLLKLVLSVTLLIAFAACSKKDDPTLSSAKEITVFNIDTAKGVINMSDHTIGLTLDATADIKKLSPAITISDKATISPASGTVQDFTNPVTYTVKAEDGSVQAYTVSVILGKSRAANILSIKVIADGLEYVSVTDSTNKVVKLVMDTLSKFTLTEATPVITVSMGATISPASGEVVDLTMPVTYKVTAENGEVSMYTVKVISSDQIYMIRVPYQGSNGLGDHYFDVSDSRLIHDEYVTGLTGPVGVFEVLETEDMSNITLQMNVPDGGTVTPDPATPQNFNKDVKYTFSNAFGSYDFTIRCVKKKGVAVSGRDISKDVSMGATSTYGGFVDYWSAAPLAKMWLVDEGAKVEYPLVITGTESRYYSYESQWMPDGAIPPGIYVYKVQAEDGTIRTLKCQIRFDMPDPDRKK